MSRLLLVLWGGHPGLRMPPSTVSADEPPARTGISWQRLRARISAAKGLPPAEANRQAEGHTTFARPRSGARSLGPGHGAGEGSERQPTPFFDSSRRRGVSAVITA